MTNTIFLRQACDENRSDNVIEIMLGKMKLTQEDLYVLCVHKRIKLVDFNTQAIVWEDLDQSAGPCGSLLLVASIHNEIEFARHLIKKPVRELNPKDVGGHTALHHATLKGSFAMVELLTEAGANTNLANLVNMTPLHHAAKMNYDITYHLKTVRKISKRLYITVANEPFSARSSSSYPFEIKFIDIPAGKYSIVT